MAARRPANDTVRFRRYRVNVAQTEVTLIEIMLGFLVEWLVRSDPGTRCSCYLLIVRVNLGFPWPVLYSIGDIEHLEEEVSWLLHGVCRCLHVSLQPPDWYLYPQR